MGQEVDKPTWTNRRRVIFGTLIYSASIIGYMVWKDSGSELHEAVSASLILLCGGVIGSYVFGAIWDDKINTRTGSSRT